MVMSEPSYKALTREQREELKVKKISEILTAQVSGITQEQMQKFFSIREDVAKAMSRADATSVSKVLDYISTWGKEIENKFPLARTYAYYHAAIGSTPDALTTATGEELLPEIVTFFETLQSLTQVQEAVA
jgi:hypothetical protein